MSDILIKGMEMPKNCAECQFSDVFEYPPDYDAEWICELNHISMSWEDAQIRNSNCPLVEVPTPHGDLIDADALKVSLAFAEKTAEWAVPALRGVLMFIDEMPTIIPADPEEEEMK